MQEFWLEYWYNENVNKSFLEKRDYTFYLPIYQYLVKDPSLSDHCATHLDQLNGLRLPMIKPK